MATRDFNERPLMLGSVIGVRSFRQSAGRVGSQLATRLYGPVKSSIPFEPGVNEAKCTVEEERTQALKVWNNTLGGPLVVGASFSATPVGSTPSGPVRPVPPNAAMGMERLINHLGRTIGLKPTAEMARQLGINVEQLEEEKPPEPPKHVVGNSSCSCGYYAYMNTEHNPHDSPGNAMGLIEGFGVMTVGTRGFRASKARLVALIGDVVDEIEIRHDYDDPFRMTSTPQGIVRRNSIMKTKIELSESEMREAWCCQDSLAKRFPTAYDIECENSTLYLHPRYVVTVTRPVTDRVVLRPIVQEYQVPVFPTLDAALAEYPLTDPSITDTETPQEA